MTNPSNRGLRGHSAPFVRAVHAAKLTGEVAKLAAVCLRQEVAVAVLAEHIGVTRATVYSWLTGKSEPRAAHKAAILAVVSIFTTRPIM